MRNNKSTCTPQDPDHSIKIKIEKTKEWLARLTSVVANGSALTQKVKSYLKKRPIKEVLHQCSMHLDTLSKRLRTNKSNRNCLRNNKLHHFNVKSFYGKLRYGESGGISNPPPDDAVNNCWGRLFGDNSEHNK